jgi:hypothetical protein
VPTDFGAAAQQSFNLIGIEATGNSIKRDAPFLQGAIGTEYARPSSQGWSLFAGGELRGRAYRNESDFNSFSAEARAGAVAHAGRPMALRGNYLEYRQEGDAPGDPKPTNDRAWRAWPATGATRSIAHAGGLQPAGQRDPFPENSVEDFNQLFVSASYLHSFERAACRCSTSPASSPTTARSTSFPTA